MPDSTAQAAFQAARNAAVSSVEPSPTAPREVTSKMQSLPQLPGLGPGSEGTPGGPVGGEDGTWDFGGGGGGRSGGGAGVFER